MIEMQLDIFLYAYGAMQVRLDRP